jgi:hypothetical protein
MTPEEEKEFVRRRKQRNVVIGLVLGGFVVLFYFITIARMGS